MDKYANRKKNTRKQLDTFMINIKNLEECCGCTACASICNHNAITMRPDTLGFLYPVVDVSKCTNCGLCEKVCSFNSNYDTSFNITEPIVYAARQKKLDEILKSRSGAVFAAISDYILEKGGVVYGAGYSNHFHVIHKRATTKAERDEFRGSKYVQSYMNDVFRHVKKDLKNGLIVLFSGTPCQTAGLNSYVGNRLRSKLLLIDIVCHGVSSPKVWEDYLNSIENREKSKVINVDFRNKKIFGWNAHKETFDFENGQTKWYRFRFYNKIHMRRSCSICPFTNTKRPSDITLGDFGGYEKNLPSMYSDNYGCSMVYCNTKKGELIFDEIKSSLILQKTKLSITLQPNLKHPTNPHRNRENFENSYVKYGYEKTSRKYGMIGYRYYLDKIIEIIRKNL